jgi:hypothetical protein
MYTIVDVVRNKVKLNNECDLFTLDIVNGIHFKIHNGKILYTKISVGWKIFFFNRRVKDILKAKIKKDLGRDLKFKIVI